jgi:hypothetical protein
MTTSVKGLDQRKSALTAGISLIIMAVAAFFAYGYIHGSLVIEGDASATFNNIASSTTLFEAEILSWLIILVLDIVVAWAFYIFLKPINTGLSLLAAWLRLIYSAILGVALMSLILVLLLTSGADYLSGFPGDQLPALVMMFLNAFDSIWSMGLIIFGGHLLVVGYLAWQSGSVPKIISLLIVLASVGYMVIHLCNLLFSQYDGLIKVLEAVFNIPMIAGELGFGIWLLIRGGKSSPKGNTSA